MVPPAAGSACDDYDVRSFHLSRKGHDDDQKQASEQKRPAPQTPAGSVPPPYAPRSSVTPRGPVWTPSQPEPAKPESRRERRKREREERRRRDEEEKRRKEAQREQAKSERQKLKDLGTLQATVEAGIGVAHAYNAVGRPADASAILAKTDASS